MKKKPAKKPRKMYMHVAIGGNNEPFFMGLAQHLSYRRGEQDAH